MVEFRMRSDRELCRVCHGNGVVKIPGGVSQCDHCEGLCWEPVAPPADNAALVARLRFTADYMDKVGYPANGDLLREAADSLAALSARPRAERDGQ